jgi:hypothetical protein
VLSVTSRAQAVPQIKIAQAVDISNLFIGGSSIVFVPQLLWLPRCFRQHAEMVKESLRYSYALRAGRLPSGKNVRPPRYGSTAGIGKNRSPSSCRRCPASILAAANFAFWDIGKTEKTGTDPPRTPFHPPPTPGCDGEKPKMAWSGPSRGVWISDRKIGEP